MKATQRLFTGIDHFQISRRRCSWCELAAHSRLLITEAISGLPLFRNNGREMLCIQREIELWQEAPEAGRPEKRTILEAGDSGLRNGKKKWFVVTFLSLWSSKIMVSIDILRSIDFTFDQYFYPAFFVGWSRLGLKPINGKGKKKKDEAEENVTIGGKHLSAVFTFLLISSFLDTSRLRFIIVWEDASRGLYFYSSFL